MATNEIVDITLFGATGFAGRLTAKHLYRRCREEGLPFAVAGRNRERLESLARELASSAGDKSDSSPPAAGEPVADAVEPPAIRIATTDDTDSLTRLAQGTKVLCSTVGPYSRLGTPVVEACAAEGTDYCDLTGEVQWMRRMIDRFDETARRSGARIVHAAGFDSIPSDLGVLLAQERLVELRGRPAEALRLRLQRQAGGVSRGTLESMVELVKEAGREAWIRELLKEPHSLEPDWTPKGRRRAAGGRGRGPRASGRERSPWRDPATGQWTLPFIMEEVNRRVVYRSNALKGYPWGKTFRYRELFLLPGGFKGFLAALTGRLLFGIGPGLIAFPPTRALISAALFPKPGEGPRLALEGGGSFEVRVELPESGEAVVSVAADRDPGYGATAIMLGETAVLLRQSRNAGGGGAPGDGDRKESTPGIGPTTGGVLTPATALGSLLAERLTTVGVRFRLEL